MNLLRAILAIFFRSPALAIANVITVLTFVAAIVLWMASSRGPFSTFSFLTYLIATLLVALMVVNHRSFMQLSCEAHGAKAMEESRHAEAEAFFRKSWAWAQGLPRNDPARSRILEWLTTVTFAQGKHGEAETFAREWLDNDENILGPD